MTLIDRFEQWYEEARPKLDSSSVSVEFTRSPSNEDSSAKLEASSAGLEGYVLVWERGFCNIEIVDSETEELLYSMDFEGVGQGDAQRDDEMFAHMETFLNRITRNDVEQLREEVVRGTRH